MICIYPSNKSQYWPCGAPKHAKTAEIRRRNGPTNQRLDGWMDRRMDRWMDGRTDRWTEFPPEFYRTSSPIGSAAVPTSILSTTAYGRARIPLTSCCLWATCPFYVYPPPRGEFSPRSVFLLFSDFLLFLSLCMFVYGFYLRFAC